VFARTHFGNQESLCSNEDFHLQCGHNQMKQSSLSLLKRTWLRKLFVTLFLQLVCRNGLTIARRRILECSLALRLRLLSPHAAAIFIWLASCLEELHRPIYMFEPQSLTLTIILSPILSINAKRRSKSLSFGC